MCFYFSLIYGKCSVTYERSQATDKRPHLPYKACCSFCVPFALSITIQMKVKFISRACLNLAADQYPDVSRSFVQVSVKTDLYHNMKAYRMRAGNTPYTAKRLTNLMFRLFLCLGPRDGFYVVASREIPVSGTELLPCGVTACSLLNRYQRFGGTLYLHRWIFYPESFHVAHIQSFSISLSAPFKDIYL